MIILQCINIASNVRMKFHDSNFCDKCIIDNFNSMEIFSFNFQIMIFAHFNAMLFNSIQGGRAAERRC